MSDREPFDFRGGPELPLPRLQITWRQEGPESWTASYDFMIPVHRLDVRNNGPDGDVGKGPGFIAANIGLTQCRRRGTPVFPDGTLETPFRDGSHASWDAHRLGLPAFVVFGDKWQAIEPRPAPAEWKDA